MGILSGLGLVAIRKNLSIILALAAAIFAGYAYIINLKLGHAETIAASLEAKNAQVLAANAMQARAITELTLQREIDQELVAILTDQGRLIEIQGDELSRQLQELAKNDEKIRAFIESPVPDELVRMLMEQTGRAGRGRADNTPGASKANEGAVSD